jgi:acetyl-CoA carboxylase biotin carboxyl carrier protein
MSNKSSDSPVDLDHIRELIDLLIEKEVDEFVIERDGVKVKIRRGAAEISAPAVAIADVAASPATPLAALPTAAGGAEDADPYADCAIVTSPMVGTFYRSPEPGGDPFVEVGGQVAVGHTLCIVEAMKLMNEIVAVLAGDGDPVEFGQRLFAIRHRG